jgi:DNA repair protein RecO (recombination protein O)
MPQTFEQYQLTLLQLQQLSSHENPDLFLRQILRQFEHVLLPELGYAIDFSIDTQQQKYRLTSLSISSD